MVQEASRLVASVGRCESLSHNRATHHADQQGLRGRGRCADAPAGLVLLLVGAMAKGLRPARFSFIWTPVLVGGRTQNPRGASSACDPCVGSMATFQAADAASGPASRSPAEAMGGDRPLELALAEASRTQAARQA